MSVRSLAVANEAAQIEASAQRAAAAKPRTALTAMASRLQVSERGLMDTLKSTVFAKANDTEFMALVIICNEYQLNPMLKEIYAFPAKGGGIVPMVSIDGWIRIMNSHPQFDGIDFDYINDAAGKTIAIEAIIYRKDRTRPIKVMEYMSECAGNTEPWKKSPLRMLRHRALIQANRIAFGFSGIVAEGEEPEYVGQIVDAPMSLPPRQSLAEELDDEIPNHDRETGEIIQRDERGFSEVDEDVARELDARTGRDDTDHGDQHDGAEVMDDDPTWLAVAKAIQIDMEAATSTGQLRAVDTRWNNARGAVEKHDTDLMRAIDKRLMERAKEVRGAK